MISALVTYLDANDAGTGFYAFAQELGLGFPAGTSHTSYARTLMPRTGAFRIVMALAGKSATFPRKRLVQNFTSRRSPRKRSHAADSVRYRHQSDVVLGLYGSVSRTSLCGHSSPRTRESMRSELPAQWGVCSGSFTARVTGAASSPPGGTELASASSSCRFSYSGSRQARKARWRSSG